MTDEHIWGDWTKAFVPRSSNKHNAAQVRVMKPGEPDPALVRIRAGDPLDSTAAVVCGDCNSSWMSGIQNRAKPFLIPLFNGEHCVLDARVQSIISAWIAMATMTGEHSTKPMKIVGIPQSDRDWLMNNLTAPNTWRIWIGRRRMVSRDGRWIHAAFPILNAENLPDVMNDDDRLANSQTTAFTIGELFIFAMSTPFPEIAIGWDWRTARRARNRLEQIWSIKYHAIFWPPPTMTDEDGRFFGTAIVRYFEDRAKKTGYR